MEVTSSRRRQVMGRVERMDSLRSRAVTVANLRMDSSRDTILLHRMDKDMDLQVVSRDSSMVGDLWGVIG